MAYFASKISDNMAVTPQGFLICKNVPIMRTGKHRYFDWELPEKLTDNEPCTVIHTAEEIFSDKTIASFEGAIFCNEHPETDVTIENCQDFQCGFVTNVRFGAATVKTRTK